MNMEKIQIKTMEMVKEIGKTTELIEFLVYAAVAFFVPFALGHPQFLVGTIVNASLVLAALNLKGQKILPIVLLPSMAVMARGLIFGPFTLFLVYMVPFIWIGNFVLVYLVTKAKKTSLSRIFTLVSGALLKSGFLYASAILLIGLGILPKIFAVSMGVTQLYTALLGGGIALSIQYLRKQKLPKIR
jgi:hypothetical protein